MPKHHVLSPGFLPPSSAPLVGFPAFLEPGRAQGIALLAQLAETQWWPIERIREHQLAQLERLVRYAIATTRHGRRHLAPLDGPLTWERWRRLPILGRREVQQRRRRLLSEDVPNAHGTASPARTSGSTGTPVVVERTALTEQMWHVLTAREHLWFERDTSQPMAVIRYAPAAAFPSGVRTDVWGRGAALIGPPGPCHALHIGSTTEQQLDWLLGRDFRYLLLYPSGLRDLLHASQRRGVRFDGLIAVRTFGEVVSDALRDDVQRLWGVPIQDLYSTQEVGYVAFQCPGHRHYHIQSESVLVEVLRQDGTPCDVGERGRLVLTNLNNLAMPLIRYEIGDHGVLGPPCPCRRGLPVLDRIVGRVHHTFRTESGDRIWLTVGIHRLPQIAPVVQHQMIQRRVGALEVRLVPSRPPTDAETTAVRAMFEDALPDDTEVTVVWVDEIPRTPSGKFLDFVSELD